MPIQAATTLGEQPGKPQKADFYKAIQSVQATAFGRKAYQLEQKAVEKLERLVG